MEQRISATGQIRVYLGKNYRLFMNERQWKNLISTAIIILLVCMVTSSDMFVLYQDTKNGVFAIISACIWVGLFNSIQSVCRERPIIKREYRTGLKISSYIMARVVFELGLCAAESLIILVVMCIRNASHLPEAGLIFPMIIDLYLTFFLVTFAADMVAVLVSSIVKSENTAMTVMPFILIIQLVMSGAVFELSGITKMISYLTISKWGMDAIISIASTDYSVYAQASLIDSEGSDPSAGHLLSIWAILAGFIIVYILLSILFLRRVDKDQR